jgi:type I restriction enzyme S subunit
MSDQLERERLTRCSPEWPVFHLKHLAQLKGGGTPSKENEAFWSNGDVPWVSPKDMKRRIIIDTEDYITQAAVSSSATSFVDTGSPLLVVRSGILRHTLPVAIAGRRVTLNQDMKAFRLNGRLNAGFFAYWIEGQSSELLLEWRQFGATVESINITRMMNGRIALPDLVIQQTIVDFLDREIARIDQLIAKKELQLGLLAEKQVAIVSRAFAGLREEGWSVFRLRHLLSSPLQYGANEAAVSDDRSAIRFIRISDLTEEGTLRDETYKSLPLEIAEPYLLRDGDVLFARSGATVGKTFIYRDDLGPACFAGYLIRAQPKRQLIDPNFLKLRTEAKDYWDFITSTNIQATIQNVSAERYAALQFPLPPMERQLQLVAQLALMKTATKTVSKKIEASINRLRELRAALITAAATGQIDVATRRKRRTTDRRLDVIESNMAAAAQPERQARA